MEGEFGMSEGEAKKSYDFTISSAPGQRSFRKRLLINTVQAREVVDVSDHVREFVKTSGIKNGLISCYNTHTTSALILANRREGVAQIISNVLGEDLRAEHTAGILQSYKGDPQVMAAYVSSAILGNSIIIPIEDGSLLMGEWQGLYFVEFSGPRERQVILTAIGS